MPHSPTGAAPARCSAKRHFIVICLLLVSVQRSTLATAGATEAGGLAWFVQVSDIHLSRLAREQMPVFGDKEGDFGHFASSILQPMVPGALVLTGDLVDGKTKLLRGAQDEGEWKTYRRLIENVTAAGIPEDAILDLRGNHDVFDVARRGVPPDFFALYGAAGRRNSTQRVSALPLLARISGGGKPRSAPDACPATVLLGVDLSPSPGLRGPTDFFGRADAQLLQEVDAVLTDMKASHRQRGCAPVIVAAGHYPLSVVVHPDTARYDRRPEAGSKDGEAAIGGDGTLRGLLAAHGVAAYLCGHLHGLFSQRQHLLHPGPAGGHLAELESTAWKDDRRFRLLVADGGALSFSDLYLNSPSKVRPRPPLAEPTADNPGRRHARGPTDSVYNIVSIEPTQRVSGHIVAIASPPDARYAPLAPPPGDGPRSFDSVRALVFPVGKTTELQVMLRWRCEDADAWQTVPMARAAEGQPLFTAPLGEALRCEPWDGTDPFARLQVVVEESDGRSSTSEDRCVAVFDSGGGGMLKSENSAAAGGGSGKKKLLSGSHGAAAGGSRKQRLAEPTAPLPLGNAAFGRFVLGTDMARFGTRCTYLLWAVHLLGLLLLPRMVPQRWATWLRGSGGSVGGIGISISGTGGGSGSGSGSAARSAEGAAGPLLRAAAAPLLALQAMSTMDIPWLLQVLYALYLARGPWLVARFLSEAPLGVYMPAGVLLRPPQPARAGDLLADGWRFTRTPDTMILCLYHWAFTLLPGTLWLAWVMSSWRTRGGGGAIKGGAWRGPATRGGWPAPCTPLQVLVGAPLLWAHLLNLRWLWRLYGPTAVLLSPGFGWTLPLTVAVLVGAWVCNSAAPANCDSAELQDQTAVEGTEQANGNSCVLRKDKHS